MIDKKNNARISSASTTKSIKFQDDAKSENGNNKDSQSVPSSILKSRSTTKLSGKY
jgi:hypothetical protein